MRVAMMVAVLALPALAALDVSGAGDDPTTHEIVITGAFVAAGYVLPYVEIQTGDSVVWHQKGLDPFAPHSATADDGSFDTGNLSAGQSSLPVVFDVPGTFTYFCKVHPFTMHGVIQVDE